MDEDGAIYDLIQPDGLSTDFSFHLTPQDLDMLIQGVCIRYNKKATTLRENLDLDNYHHDTENCGAYYVKPTIRNLFVSLNTDQATAIAEMWYQDLSSFYQENIRPEAAVADAIRDMIKMCQTAAANELDVVHYWSL